MFAFTANDIDLDLLLYLDISALDKVLPEVTYGKKLKLLQKIKELKELEIPCSQVTDIASVSECRVFVFQLYLKCVSISLLCLRRHPMATF